LEIGHSSFVISSLFFGSFYLIGNSLVGGRSFICTISNIIKLWLALFAFSIYPEPRLCFILPLAIVKCSWIILWFNSVSILLSDLNSAIYYRLDKEFLGLILQVLLLNSTEESNSLFCFLLIINPFRYLKLPLRCINRQEMYVCRLFLFLDCR
jgi:hypothetical protein